MNTQSALKLSMDMGEMVGLGYLGDLSDAEMLHRPTPEMNHLNWQFGHLILSEHELMKAVAPDLVPALPAGFSERYGKSTQPLDALENFFDKAQLMEAYRTQRDGALKVLESLSDEDLDRPTGIEYAPTVGAAMSLLGSHILMHAGQWAVVRRQLGRPPLF